MCQNYYCLDQSICTLMKLLQMNSTWLAMKYEKDCSTIVPKWMMVGWLKDESTNHFLGFCQPSSCHKPAWTFRNQPDLINTNTQLCRKQKHKYKNIKKHTELKWHSPARSEHKLSKMEERESTKKVSDIKIPVLPTLLTRVMEERCRKQDPSSP